jgi:hypothetical protein
MPNLPEAIRLASSSGPLTAPLDRPLQLPALFASTRHEGALRGPSGVRTGMRTLIPPAVWRGG